ncbi:MAG: site-specific DNA-methyltransferase [Planctomycetaceae bacterium]|nr:MAG: site-specific DNA-methyltransferase [Planctomycetaceae bacterium]
MSAWPDGFVDLAYLDPPFLTQKRHKSTNRERSKTFAFDDLWGSHHDYSEFIYQRVAQCHRILKDTGSIYFHCDRNATHIARAVLDDIFGAERFRSEIIWTYRRWSNSKNGLLASHQNIFYYTKSENFKFNQLLTDYSPSTNVDQILQQRARDSNGKSIYRRDKDGNVISNGAKRGVPLGDVWDIPYLNPKANERVGYPTQKPILLLERIIELSTDSGDIVVDPFCGSGTTLVASSLSHRKFIGIDVSAEACQLSRSRLSSPVKTESALLETGRASYANADSQLLQCLSGCDYVPVQRNSGIDAIVNAPTTNSIALVRIQRADETVNEAASLLIKASRGKNADLLIVVKTRHVATLFDDDEATTNVQVIESTAFAVNEAVAALQREA